MTVSLTSKKQIIRSVIELCSEDDYSLIELSWNVTNILNDLEKSNGFLFELIVFLEKRHRLISKKKIHGKLVFCELSLEILRFQLANISKLTTDECYWFGTE